MLIFICFQVGSWNAGDRRNATSNEYYLLRAILYSGRLPATSSSISVWVWLSVFLRCSLMQQLYLYNYWAYHSKSGWTSWCFSYISVLWPLRTTYFYSHNAWSVGCTQALGSGTRSVAAGISWNRFTISLRGLSKFN